MALMHPLSPTQDTHFLFSESQRSWDLTTALFISFIDQIGYFKSETLINENNLHSLNQGSEAKPLKKV